MILWMHNPCTPELHLYYPITPRTQYILIHFLHKMIKYFILTGTPDVRSSNTGISSVTARIFTKAYKVQPSNTSELAIIMQFPPCYWDKQTLWKNLTQGLYLSFNNMSYNISTTMIVKSEIIFTITLSIIR